MARGVWHCLMNIMITIWLQHGLSSICDAASYYLKGNECFSCNSSSDEGPCGRMVNPDDPSIPTIPCDGACQLRYHRNSSGTSYLRLCAGEWCEDITSMEMVHPSASNVGSVSIHRCCQRKRCNVYLEDVRCYTCESGIRHGICEDVLSGTIHVDFCSGMCMTLVTRNGTGSLTYERNCVEQCPEGEYSGDDSIMALRCCKTDLCNGSDQSLLTSIQESLQGSGAASLHRHWTGTCHWMGMTSLLTTMSVLMV